MVLQAPQGRQRGRIALGSYPDVGPKKAREARDAAKSQKSEGLDPVQVRKVEKLKSTRIEGDTFKAVALEWYGKQAPSGVKVTQNALCGSWSATCSPG